MFALARVQRLSREMHPSVERGCPFFAASARLDSRGVSYFLDDIAQTYFLLDEEPWKTYAIRPVLRFLSVSLRCFFIVHDIYLPL
jgi:hypothetical protein